MSGRGEEGRPGRPVAPYIISVLDDSELAIPRPAYHT